MPNVCVECAKDLYMKSLIGSEGAKGDCAICGSSEVVLDVEDARLFQLIKTLIRYYFSEWEYNPHFSGVGYENLFYGEDNRFFEESRAQSEESYESVVLGVVEGPVYEDYDKGVSVFAGYGPDGDQQALLKSLSTDLDFRVLEISNRLRIENHFDLEKEMKIILEEYNAVTSLHLAEGMELFRARVGYHSSKRFVSHGFESEFHYKPYIGSEIDAPPPQLAANGRINREGVSFLYCATDRYTAVSEVRPHPGDRVSLAKLVLNSDVVVFDLSSNQLLHFFECDKNLDRFRTLNTLGYLINDVVPPSEKFRYSITQLIADCIRQLGFQGVYFNSTTGNGKNVVLFDAKLARQDLSAAEIVIVDSVKYEYQKEKIVEEKNDYW